MMENGSEDAVARISAIIVTYDGDLHSVEKCVASLRAQSLPPAELILSDNSPDGRFAAHFGSAGLITVRNERNEGFTGGTWAGAHAATCGKLLFVNPDAQLSSNCLELLNDALSADPRAVIAGAQILLPDGKVNAGEAAVHFSGLAWCGNYRGTPEDGDARDAFAVSGCACLVDAGTFERFRGFRSRFGLYYDDTDLCWRTRAAGLKTLFVPKATAIHDYSDKGAYRWLWVERNRLLMLLTNTEVPTLLLLLPGLLVIEAGSWAMALSGGWWRYKLRAYLEVASRPGWLLRERREMTSLRRLPDSDILPRLRFELEAPGRALPRYLRALNRALSGYGSLVLRASTHI